VTISAGKIENRFVPFFDRIREHSICDPALVVGHGAQDDRRCSRVAMVPLLHIGSTTGGPLIHLRDSIVIGPENQR
jgi:hypothetical protein